MTIRRLHVVYVRPSKYDDDGYVLRYWRGILPSNSMICLRTLTEQAAASGALGEGVRVTVACYDDTVERIPVKRIARLNRRADTRVVVGLVGVQSNQFPRASALALALRAAGVPVMIGGFHVSGMLAMFDTPAPELEAMTQAGVTLVKGEAEAPGALEGILRDALAGTLEPVYDIADPPALTHAVVPQARRSDLRRFFSKKMATIDTSRGCPYNCSFCTVINVQGRKMRCRPAEAVLEAVKANCAQGIRDFFFTDDNFARNRHWRPVLEGLAALRAAGENVQFMMQVDVQAHRIPGFLELAAKAGCFRAFIGVESLNERNLEAVEKSQNHASGYADMAAAWHAHGILVYAGYIIGFPYDTPESVARDVATLYEQVQVDTAAFFMLTPLPGSRDHQRMAEAATPMDADLNNFDSVHETFCHPGFAPGQWQAAYRQAWLGFYSKENIINTLLRTPAKHYWGLFWNFMYFRYCALMGSHPMMTGLFPRILRERRPDWPRESLARCAARRWRSFAAGLKAYAKLSFEFQEIWMLTRAADDPRGRALADLRQRWLEAQQRLREADVTGRCDSAIEELRAVLKSASHRLHALSENPQLSPWLVRRRLAKKAREIDAFLHSLEFQMPTWRQAVRAEQFVTESLLAGYENLAIRYVAKRRRFNAYRRELLDKIRTGRILSLDVTKAAATCVFELYMGARFWTAALRQTFLVRPRLDVPSAGHDA